MKTPKHIYNPSCAPCRDCGGLGGYMAPNATRDDADPVPCQRCNMTGREESETARPAPLGECSGETIEGEPCRSMDATKRRWTIRPTHPCRIRAARDGGSR